MLTLSHLEILTKITPKDFLTKGKQKKVDVENHRKKLKEDETSQFRTKKDVQAKQIWFSKWEKTMMKKVTEDFA